MLLNGDSSSLPLPGASIDAVVTDPPYFDFVHYSELSDFFFAWLSPALRRSTPSFDRVDSSHEGEVQDRDPDVFSEKISRVFAECNRVLKDHGMLVFTFHHSATSGWLAIYKALARAGFVVAAAHPIKAEMSVGSPKSSAKEPINLDAILVCRKKSGTALSENDVAARVINDSSALFSSFSAIGRQLSRGDRFVIAASQVLRHSSASGLADEPVRALLDEAHARCYSDATGEPRTPSPIAHRAPVASTRTSSRPKQAAQLDLPRTVVAPPRARRRT
jgi:putative DNA methylase